jgi:hypothetical protein
MVDPEEIDADGTVATVNDFSCTVLSQIRFASFNEPAKLPLAPVPIPRRPADKRLKLVSFVDVGVLELHVK